VEGGISAPLFVVFFTILLTSDGAYVRN
jgi:hypothetical protein